MSIYENCFKYGLRFCAVSPLDSTWYIEYICSNRSRYNVLDPSTTQLKALSSIHTRLETKLENALEK